MTESNKRIILYTSRMCLQAWAVERFMEQNDIPVERISIDGNPQARQEVMAINNGYASVPTLVFPDGQHLTEPSFRQLRAKLGLETPGLVDKLRGLLGGGEDEQTGE